MIRWMQTNKWKQAAVLLLFTGGFCLLAYCNDKPVQAAVGTAEATETKAIAETAEIVKVENNIINEQEKDVHEEVRGFDETEDLGAFYQKPEGFTDEYSYIDYDYIERYHEILFHNITAAPIEDYDDTVLEEYLKEDIEKDTELLTSGSGEEQPLTIDYHLFDFNDDGLEDYLVCLQGTFWSQGDKGTVRIYIQEQNGTLQKVFEYYVYSSTFGYHPPVAVLSEKADGYHLLALPGLNALLRYDKETRRYETCEIESNTDEPVEDEIHVGMTEEEYAEKKEMYENIKHIDMNVYIDYEFIEAKHKVLRHNICTAPKDAIDNPLLKEELKDDVEDYRRMYEEGITSVPLYIDYFPFDFNDDGLEDYLLCYHAPYYSGSGGNSVDLYIQESDGSLRKAFSVTMRLHDYVSPCDHSPIAILDEKDAGYYAFVLVGSNRIIRYSEEEGWYKFEEREVIENPYFPAVEHVALKIHAEYYSGGFVDEIADAEINRIKIYEEGCVYKLTMYIVPFMFSWYFESGENMSIYLYVTADKIYLIWPYAQPEPGGKSIDFYDNDDLLVETLDTDEKLQSIGVLQLICQEEDMHEENFSMTQEGNRITYHYSETKVNGEPGGEDLFVWEKGKGLVEFGTGWGAGPMDVHVDEICEVTESEDIK